MSESRPRDPEPPAELVRAAQSGDGATLEAVVMSVRDRIYRLCLRMTASPADAEDAMQEILIKVITRLAMFRGDATFSTWVHRIAVNHLMDRSKSVVERMQLTFDAFSTDLRDGLSASPSAAPDAALLEHEVQLACTHAMLTCLDREDRIVYVLGDIFGVDSDDGGYICEISADTYRRRLSSPVHGSVRSCPPTADSSTSPLHAGVRSGSTSQSGAVASIRNGCSSPTQRSE